MNYYIKRLTQSKIPKATFISFIDQLSLNFIHFFIGFVFIYKGTPEQYGIFSFLISIFYLYASIQNAIINNPLMVLSPRLSNPKKRTLERGLLGLLLGCFSVILFISIIFFIIFSDLSDDKSISKVQILFFFFCIPLLMLRDFWRANEYANLKPGNALKRDALYSLFAFILIAVIAIFFTFSIELVFISMGISALVIVIIPTIKTLRPFISFEEIYLVFKETWGYSKWSFLGAISSWLQMQAFIYLPFFIIGVKEVAYLSAARLLMIPPLLLSKSWGNYLKPIASSKFAGDKYSDVSRLFLHSLLFISVLIGLYTMIIFVLMNIVPENWIPNDYQGIEKFIIYWAMITFFMTIRSSLSSLFQASLVFRSLAFCEAATAVFTIIITVILLNRFSISGSLAGRLLGEIFLIIILVFLIKYFPLMKKTKESMSS